MWLVLVEGGFVANDTPSSRSHLSQSASGFTTRSDIGPAREGPSAETIACVLSTTLLSKQTDRFHREAQARRGEEQEVDPDQFQDPDNEYGLFAGTTYEADDEEADKIYEQVDKNMDARRRVRRYVNPSNLMSCIYRYAVQGSARRG